MKKILSIILTFVLLVSSFPSLSYAQSNNNLDAWLATLAGGFGSFGYIGTNISVDDISSTQVTFESPVILDDDDDDVLKYVLWYGPHPFSSLIDSNSTASADDFTSKEITFTNHTSSSFTFSLSTNDGIDPNTLYYATVVPIAENGDSGEMSGPDICFKLSTQEHDIGTVNCANLLGDSANQHNSAGANMAMANIDNTCNNNSITLSRVAVAGATKVAIYRIYNTGQAAQLLTTRNMSAETYTFPLSNPTPPVVLRFVPLNANDEVSGTQIDYTLKLCSTPAVTPPPATQTPPPSVGKVPVVGPEQDIAYIVLASLFLYGVFRLVRYRKNS